MRIVGKLRNLTLWSKESQPNLQELILKKSNLTKPNPTHRISYSSSCNLFCAAKKTNVRRDPGVGIIDPCARDFKIYYYYLL